MPNPSPRHCSQGAVACQARLAELEAWAAGAVEVQGGVPRAEFRPMVPVITTTTPAGCRILRRATRARPESKKRPANLSRAKSRGGTTCRSAKNGSLSFETPSAARDLRTRQCSTGTPTPISAWRSAMRFGAIALAPGSAGACRRQQGGTNMAIFDEHLRGAGAGRRRRVHARRQRARADLSTAGS